MDEVLVGDLVFSLIFVLLGGYLRYLAPNPRPRVTGLGRMIFLVGLIGMETTILTALFNEYIGIAALVAGAMAFFMYYLTIGKC